MTRAVLSLGSNLGDRAGHLRLAVAGLGDTLLTVSGVYESRPWGDADQPDYLNAAALVADPGFEARDWLRMAQRLEETAGRERDPARRFGPRTLDVDVIAVWDDDGVPVTVEDPDLTVPHPRAHLRAFVLRPWLDIQPYARVPDRGWLYDLVRAGPVAGDLPDLHPREDISIDPDENHLIWSRDDGHAAPRRPEPEGTA
jgi:2-amino-4-hydroxy-6-hydroxymethyldihydropteridine diphosphokinase